MVNDMKKKACRSSLINFDPINGIRNETLSKIFTSSEFLTDLPDRISDALSDNSQNKLESQINKHFESIKKSIEIFDYNMTIYKLDQLSMLKDILKKREINKSFESVIETLVENFQIQFKDKNDKFKNKIEKNIFL